MTTERPQAATRMFRDGRVRSQHSLWLDDALWQAATALTDGRGPFRSCTEIIEHVLAAYVAEQGATETVAR